MASFTHGYDLGKGGSGANALAMGQNFTTANSQYRLSNTGSGGNPADAASKPSGAKKAAGAAAGAALAYLEAMQGIGAHAYEAAENNAALELQRLDLFRQAAAAISSNTNEGANSAFGATATSDINKSLLGQADVQSESITRRQNINDLIAAANKRSQQISAIISAVNGAAAAYAAGGG